VAIDRGNMECEECEPTIEYKTITKYKYVNTVESGSQSIECEIADTLIGDLNPDLPKCVTFRGESGGNVGYLIWGDDGMYFVGDVDDSAELLFEAITQRYLDCQSDKQIYIE